MWQAVGKSPDNQENLAVLKISYRNFKKMNWFVLCNAFSNVQINLEFESELTEKFYVANHQKAK